MLWSSSPTTQRLRSAPASNSRRRLCAKFVSWNSSTMTWANLGDEAKGPGDAAEPAVFLQEPLGEGMVGENESLAGWEVVFLLDSIEHLTGGLFCEGQEQDALGGHALLAQAPVALDQDPRFSGARPRHDQ